MAMSTGPIGTQAVAAAARIHHRLHCPACGLHSGQECDGEPTELDLAAARQILEAGLSHDR